MNRISHASLVLILLICSCATWRPASPRAVDTEEVAALYKKAEAYYRNYFYAKALAVYHEVLEKDSRGDFADNALYKIAGIHMRQERPEEAVIYFQRLRAEHPDSPYAVESIYNLGFCYYQMGDPKRALDVYEQYLRLADTRHRTRARVLAAQALAALGRYDQALRQYAGAGAEERDKKKQVEILQAVKELIENSLSTEDLILALDDMESGVVSDYCRYRAARDKLAAGFREEALGLRAGIDLGRANFRFYKNARELGGFAAWASSDSTEGEETASSRVGLRIGVVLPLSGRFEVFGQQVLHGIMMAVDDFGSPSGEKRIEVLIRDSEGEGAVAREKVEDLARNPKVVAIIGPLLVKESEPAAEAAQELQIPLIALSRKEGLTRDRSWVFRNAMTFTHQVRALIDYATKHLGARRFAVLHPENPYGEAFKNAFVRELGADRYLLTARVGYPPDATDFRQVIRDLRAGGAVDAIFIPDEADRIALLAPQLIYHGVRDVDLLGPSSWNKDALSEKAAAYLKRAVIVDAFFPRAENPRTRAFTQKFQDLFGETPTLLSALGYDSIGLLARVVESGNADTRPALRRGLLQIRSYPGLSGDTTFLETGEVEKTLTLLRVGKDGIEEKY